MIMKKILFSFTFIVISLIANCQNTKNIQAAIASYKYRDTIKIADFLRLSEVSLNKKEYSIVSFTLSFKDNSYVVSFESNSNKITDEMKNGLKNRKDKDAEYINLIVERIIAQTSQSKNIRIAALVYKLKMK